MWSYLTESIQRLTRWKQITHVKLPDRIHPAFDEMKTNNPCEVTWQNPSSIWREKQIIMWSYLTESIRIWREKQIIHVKYLTESIQHLTRWKQIIHVKLPDRIHPAFDERKTNNPCEVTWQNPSSFDEIKTNNPCEVTWQNPSSVWRDKNK